MRIMESNELLKLKSENAAFSMQRKILEKSVAMARSPDRAKMMKKTLKKCVEVATILTGAEDGSLFLLDEKGSVTNSILMRGELPEEKKSDIIHSIVDRGLAGWVSKSRKLGLVGNTDTDDRWLTLPEQPYIARSALAVPILRGEELFGILTLIHSVQDYFDKEKARLMKATAKRMSLVLENVRLYAKLDESYCSLAIAKKAAEEYSKALQGELKKAWRIQKDFLPASIPHIPNWKIETCFLPAIQVAGDFYDVFRLPGNYLGLVIADVCDKGIGSALYMALLRSLIRIFSGQTKLCGLTIDQVEAVKNGLISIQTESGGDQTQPLQAIPITNNYLLQNHGTASMFATIIFGVLDPTNGQLFYINAGHEPPFIANRSGIKHHLMPTGPAVGAFPDAEFKIGEIQLEPGDKLIGYTDGVSEAISPEGALFKKDRLEKIIAKHKLNAFDLMNRIKTALTQFTGNTPQSDDITILIAQRNK